MQSRSRCITKEAPQRPVLAAAFVLLASLAFVTPAGAQAMPQPQDCSMEPDDGARIKCKYGNIIAQQGETALMLSTLPDLPASQKAAMMNQVERTSRAQGRAFDEDFKQLTKKMELSCEVSEIIGDMKGDDNGVCDPGEDCAEVLGDQIGNDDGICRPRNGMNREVCVEICDSEAFNSNPGNFDPDLGVDVEEELDEITVQYVELNQTLDEEMQFQAAARVLAANGDSCAAMIAGRSNTDLIRGFVIAAASIRGAADLAERPCDQTFFGANTAAVCAIIEGIAAGAAITAAVFESRDGAIDSDTIDASYACLGSLNMAVGGLTVAAGDTETALIDIQNNQMTIQQNQDAIRTNQAIIMDLLKTPAGQRLEVSNNP